jgi:K+/H+ antiporter YhaU regulatory subunit KhtT
MKATKSERVGIKISKHEVYSIIINHLASKGFEVNHCSAIIETVYDGTMGDTGTEEFTGLTIVANEKKEEFEI